LTVPNFHLPAALRAIFKGKAIVMSEFDSETAAVATRARFTIKNGSPKSDAIGCTVQPITTDATDARITAARDAWSRLSRRQIFADWMVIAEALAVGREHVLYTTKSNKASGKKYNAAIGDWLDRQKLAGVPKDVRSCLLVCYDNKAEILDWLAADDSRAHLNHPAVVLRRWRADTGEKPVPADRGAKLVALLEKTDVDTLMAALPAQRREELADRIAGQNAALSAQRTGDRALTRSLVAIAKAAVARSDPDAMANAIAEFGELIRAAGHEPNRLAVYVHQNPRRRAVS
jgi:hypothetical protein